MDPYTPQQTNARQTIVTVMLASMGAAFFLFLLILISGGFFIYLVGILAAIALFGAFHYLLWGRLLVKETSEESEEARLRDKALAEDWSDEGEA